MSGGRPEQPVELSAVPRRLQAQPVVQHGRPVAQRGEQLGRAAGESVTYDRPHPTQRFSGGLKRCVGRLHRFHVDMVNRCDDYALHRSNHRLGQFDTLGFVRELSACCSSCSGCLHGQAHGRSIAEPFRRRLLGCGCGPRPAGVPPPRRANAASDDGVLDGGRRRPPLGFFLLTQKSYGILSTSGGRTIYIIYVFCLIIFSTYGAFPFD